MKYFNDTIIAISTPILKSAIGIIRISGINVIKILSIYFKKKNITPRYAYFAKFFDKNNDIIDEGILIYFNNPKSFTGEDMLEFQCHGNPIIMDYIINCIINNNLARIALNGEFTRRSFMNNKIDLCQSESVLDVINSENIYLTKLAIKSLNGTFSKKIENIITLLIDFKILVESYINFSNDDDNISIININKKFTDIRSTFNKIIEECDNSFKLRRKVIISIFGKPNVGKSTLFNTLIKKNRSIITSIPGTTRDNIIDDLFINNQLIKIIDTAGIRKTKDVIEKIGINKTISNINNSNILLFIIDNNLNINDLNNNFYDYIEKYIDNVNLFNLFKKNIKNIIFVRNKLDLFNYNNEIIILSNKLKVINISAKNKIGIDNLIKEIKNKLNIYNVKDKNIDFLANKRNIDIINQSFSYINKYIDLFKCNDFTILSEDINYAINELTNILGKNISNEELLNSIFSKFCIGK